MRKVITGGKIEEVFEIEVDKDGRKRVVARKIPKKKDEGVKPRAHGRTAPGD